MNSIYLNKYLGVFFSRSGSFSRLKSICFAKLKKQCIV